MTFPLSRSFTDSDLHTSLSKFSTFCAKRSIQIFGTSSHTTPMSATSGSASEAGHGAAGELSEGSRSSSSKLLARNKDHIAAQNDALRAKSSEELNQSSDNTKQPSKSRPSPTRPGAKFIIGPPSSSDSDTNPSDQPFDQAIDQSPTLQIP
jgi:hypothetical protein